MPEIRGQYHRRVLPPAYPPLCERHVVHSVCSQRPGEPHCDSCSAYLHRHLSSRLGLDQEPYSSLRWRIRRRWPSDLPYPSSVRATDPGSLWLRICNVLHWQRRQGWWMHPRASGLLGRKVSFLGALLSVSRFPLRCAVTRISTCRLHIGLRLTLSTTWSCHRSCRQASTCYRSVGIVSRLLRFGRSARTSR